MMGSLAETMSALKRAGTAQNRKVYARHGIGENAFGVSLATLRGMAERIKKDHALACELWSTGNHDARMLATMVADPDALDARTLNAWVKDLDNYAITDAFADLVSRSPLARKKADQWHPRKDEWVGRTGWLIISKLAMSDPGFADAYFEGLLPIAEEQIHRRANRTRDAINNAVIAIGIRNGNLRKQAIASAERIGKVEVDHGETSCKTPDAVPYIEKAWNRKRKVAKAG